jgi:hypothetical protein
LLIASKILNHSILSGWLLAKRQENKQREANVKLIPHRRISVHGLTGANAIVRAIYQLIEDEAAMAVSGLSAGCSGTSLMAAQPRFLFSIIVSPARRSPPGTRR